jgi:hypothetical protein
LPRSAGGRSVATIAATRRTTASAAIATAAVTAFCERHVCQRQGQDRCQRRKLQPQFPKVEFPSLHFSILQTNCRLCGQCHFGSNATVPREARFNQPHD